MLINSDHEIITTDVLETKCYRLKIRGTDTVRLHLTNTRTAPHFQSTILDFLNIKVIMTKRNNYHIIISEYSATSRTRSYSSIKVVQRCVQEGTIQNYSRRKG